MAAFPPLTKATDDWIQLFKTAPPKEEDGQVITRLHSYFLTAIDLPVWNAWREHASRDYAFREGDHWTPAELKELNERGQPPTVRNEVKPIIDRVHGQFLATRQTTTFVGRNTPQDDPVAELQADLLKFTDHKSGYEFAESNVTLDGLTGGMGVIECGWEFDHVGYKCIYQREENPFHLVPDPFSVRNDLRDAKCVQRAKWLARAPRLSARLCAAGRHWAGRGLVSPSPRRDVGTPRKSHSHRPQPSRCVRHSDRSNRVHAVRERARHDRGCHRRESAK